MKKAETIRGNTVIRKKLLKEKVSRYLSLFLTMKEMEFGKTKGTLLYKTFDFVY